MKIKNGKFYFFALLLVASFYGCGGVSESPLKTGDGFEMNAVQVGRARQPSVGSNEGHLLCVSGQSGNVIRAIRPDMNPESFPASFYIEDPDSGFPITDIADLSPLRSSGNSVFGVFSGNGSSPESLSGRFLFSFEINLERRSYTLNRIGKLPGEKEISSYVRHLKQLGQPAVISALYDSTMYLVPMFQNGMFRWTILSPDEKQDVYPTKWPYPEYFNPQMLPQAGILSFQTFNKEGKIRKKFFERNEGGEWVDVTPLNDLPAEVDQLGGEAIPLDEGFWWIEKASQSASIAFFKKGFSRSKKIELPTNGDLRVSPKHLSLVRERAGIYKLGLLFTNGQINEVRELLWDPSDATLQVLGSISLNWKRPAPDRSEFAVLRDLLSDKKFIFVRQEEETGGESVLRYSRIGKSWSRLSRTECTGLSFAGIDQ